MTHPDKDRTAVDKLKSTLTAALDSADALEAFGVALLAKVAPWAAPFPTAYLVWARTVEHLHWPWQVGAATAAAVESLGLVTMLTALEAWRWNRTRTRQTDPRAPLALPIGLVGGYFVAAELLTVGLDILPRWGSLTAVDWVPAIFPLLSLVGVGVIAARVDQAQRASEVEAATAERRRLRMERKAESQEADKAVDTEATAVDTETTAVDTETTAVDTEAGPLDAEATKAANLDKLLDIYRQSPRLAVPKAARTLAVSRQTVYNYLTDLEAAGRIRRNGHGVEVLEASHGGASGDSGG